MASDKVKETEMKSEKKEVKKHNNDLKKSLRRSNDVLRELPRYHLVLSTKNMKTCQIYERRRYKHKIQM